MFVEYSNTGKILYLDSSAAMPISTEGRLLLEGSGDPNLHYVDIKTKTIKEKKLPTVEFSKFTALADGHDEVVISNIQPNSLVIIPKNGIAEIVNSGEITLTFTAPGGHLIKIIADTYKDLEAEIYAI